MKIVKRILLVLLILVVLFIAALVAIPYFFKDEIIDESLAGRCIVLQPCMATREVSQNPKTNDY